MDRMHQRVGRVAQRDDVDVHAGLLEAEDLLGDERLGKTRIPLQHECDRTGQA